MSRQNLCPNPSAKNNVTGWTGGATPTQVTGLGGFPVSTGAKWTSGTFATMPTGAASPATQYTMSVYVQNNTGFDANNKTLYFAATRSAGGDDFSQSKLVSLPNGVITRIDFTATTVANTTGIYLLLDGINAALGTGVTVTACLIEAGATLNSYADGDTSGWVWDGADGNSTSSESNTFSTTLTAGVTADLTARGALGGRESAGVTAGLTLAGQVAYATTLTAGVTAGLSARGALATSASAGATAGLTLAGLLTHSVSMGVSAGLTLAGSATPGTETPSGWNTILGAVNEARAEHKRHRDRQRHPIDCPVHLWPLEPVGGNRYHCKFGGHVVIGR